MMTGVDYEFEWDDAKAEANASKHGADTYDLGSLRDTARA